MRRSTREWLAAAPWCMAASACSLDERTLHEMPMTSGCGGATTVTGADTVGGAAGHPETAVSGVSVGGGDTSSEGATGQGGAGPGTATGLGGAAGEWGVTASGTTFESSAGGSSGGSDPGPRCPDLDANQVPDCHETLANNAGFDAGADGWLLETDASVIWSPVDAGDAVSGSIAVTNSAYIEDNTRHVLRGISQCLEAQPSITYLALTQVRVPAAPPQGFGGLSVWFYEQTGCRGDRLDPVASFPLLGTTSDWSATGNVATAPANARTMLVRLVVNKLFSVPEFSVEFDNVLIKEESNAR